jgi:sugar phosphate isomerase/epimerase
MKYSLFTVSVPEMTPEEALKKMKEYGYDGVDWRVTALPTDPAILAEAPSYWRNNYCTIDIDTVDEKAEELRALTEKYGLEINALATYLDCSDAPEKIEKCMIAAKKMGCGRIRVNSLKYDAAKGYTQLFGEAVAGFKKVEELAKKHGIKADFEMHHGTITASASSARRLASFFDPQYIGVIYDTGNIVYEGYEEYQLALEVLGPYLDLVHIKNAKWVRKEVDGKEVFRPDWAPFTDGHADFERVFKALKAVGYDGYVTFEDFSSEETSDEKLKTNINFIRSVVEAVK